MNANANISLCSLCPFARKISFYEFEINHHNIKFDRRKQKQPKTPKTPKTWKRILWTLYALLRLVQFRLWVVSHTMNVTTWIIQSSVDHYYWTSTRKPQKHLLIELVSNKIEMIERKNIVMFPINLILDSIGRWLPTAQRSLFIDTLDFMPAFH